MKKKYQYFFKKKNTDDMTENHFYETDAKEKDAFVDFQSYASNKNDT